MQKKVIRTFLFFKTNFDKAYDRLEWEFILESLKAMGLNPPFISYVQTLFGNAKARVDLNGHVTNNFSLHRSIRQGFPLALLLYAIAANELYFLVQRKIGEGAIKCITLPNGEQMCLQLFGNDTSALFINEQSSLQAFWQCLDTYCLASGSMINHSKTSY